MCGSPLYQSRVFNYNLTEKDPLFTRIILPAAYLNHPAIMY